MRRLIPVLFLVGCWPFIPPGSHAPGTQVWGAVSVVHRIDAPGGSPETTVRAVFLDEPHDVWNLAECLDGDGTCATSEPVPTEIIALNAPPLLGDPVDVGVVSIGGATVEPPRDLGKNWLYEGKVTDYQPGQALKLELDGHRLETEVPIQSPGLPDLIAPADADLLPLPDDAFLSLEWVSGRAGTPYIEVRPLYGGASSRLHVLRDDGSRTLPIEKLEIPGIDEVELVFGRMQRTRAWDVRHQVEVLVRTEEWRRAIRVPTGAKPLSAYPSCDFEDDYGISWEGVYYGVIQAHTDLPFDPSVDLAAGECSNVQAAAHQSWSRVGLYYDQAALLGLTRPGATSVLYGYDGWDCAASPCIASLGVTSGRETLYMLNQRDLNGTWFAFVMDAVEPDASGTFVLEVDYVAPPELQRVALDWNNTSSRDGDEMVLDITAAADTHYRLSLASWQNLGVGWVGEDCYGNGILDPNGTPISRCHEFEGDTLTLDTVTTWSEVVPGQTTMVHFESQFGGAWGGVNYLLEGVNTGHCWVWGAQVGSWNDLGCTNISSEMLP